MVELVFEVIQEADGGYCAECLTESMFTEGDTWDELRNNVLQATSAFFLDRPAQSVFASPSSATKSSWWHEGPGDVSGGRFADLLCRKRQYSSGAAGGQPH